MLVQCKICQKLKVRVRLEWATRSNTFVDDKGKRWNGFHCAPCRYARDKRLRHRSNTVTMSNRKCRKCGLGLPNSHYFLHPECRGRMWDLLDTETYSINFR